jgi:hypothetical protein
MGGWPCARSPGYAAHVVSNRIPGFGLVTLGLGAVLSKKLGIQLDGVIVGARRQVPAGTHVIHLGVAEALALGAVRRAGRLRSWVRSGCPAAHARVSAAPRTLWHWRWLL